MTERQIYSGTTYLGCVRETTSGDWVAVVDEHVVGEFTSVKAATDKILELARQVTP